MCGGSRVPAQAAVSSASNSSAAPGRPCAAPEAFDCDPGDACDDVSPRFEPPARGGRRSTLREDGEFRRIPTFPPAIEPADGRGRPDSQGILVFPFRTTPRRGRRGRRNDFVHGAHDPGVVVGIDEPVRACGHGDRPLGGGARRQAGTPDTAVSSRMPPETVSARWAPPRSWRKSRGPSGSVSGTRGSCGPSPCAAPASTDARRSKRGAAGSAPRLPASSAARARAGAGAARSPCRMLARC